MSPILEINGGTITVWLWVIGIKVKTQANDHHSIKSSTLGDHYPQEFKSPLFGPKFT